MKKKIALIFGITGQDGSYLAEILLKKNYIVHGVKRRSSSINTLRVDHIYQDPHDKNYRFRLHYGDVTDTLSVSNIIKKIKPDEIYNLAAQSHVAVSFEVPEYTANADALGALRILEAIKFHKLEKKTKFYQAGTSEMYGKVQSSPQNEKTPFYPLSPYGVAKLYAHWITKNYREAYKIFACNGILFNHESPRRGETFVTRKITRGLSRINEGLDSCLFMGNLDAKRDWGHAKDYVEMQWLMLQQEKAEDFVIATGRMETVRTFIELSAKALGWDKLKNKKAIIWEGKGIKEVGRRADTGDVVIRIDPRYYRPTEVDELLGDASKALKKLGWVPTTTLEMMIEEMILNDKEEARKESILKNKGFNVSTSMESPPSSIKNNY